ncbi:MAG: isoprenylcysteine carboxylmethyltransferase family protein [Anaerolineae bacterium]|nr:isoprenylcysteine carboxylmethyltransferase family protein [Anaerolineae bacterium]
MPDGKGREERHSLNACEEASMLRIVVWIVMLVGGSILSLWLDWRWARSVLLSPLFHLATLVVGALLLRFVLRVSRHTGSLLARLGREGDIPRLETNKLVTEGVYGCMRHPMHFGLLFFPWAIAFLLGSPTFILLVAPLEMAFIVAMIKLVEEPEAIHKFGDAYREYQRRVPMFNLCPSCLRQLLGPEQPGESQEPLP